MSDDMLYAKRGKRYQPWGRFYDPGVIQCGTWLVRCTDTGTSYYRVQDSAEPELAAAMLKARSAMVSAMSAASNLRPVPRQTPITAQQRQLLDALEATGFCTSVWEWPALDEIVQAGLDALRLHD